MKIKRLILLAMMAIVMPLHAFAQSYDANAVSKYNEGVDFSNKGEYQSAIEAFKASIALDPTFTDAYYNLGSVYEFLKDSNNALLAYKEVIKRNPEDSETAFKIATIYYWQGYSQKAISYLALIPSSSPKYPQAKELYGKVAANLAPKTTNPAVAASVSQSAVHKPAATVTPALPKKVVYKQFSGPTGITTDTLGNIYVANYADNSIEKISKAGQRKVFVRDGIIKGPLGLANDSSNNIYVASYLSDQVLKITPAGSISVLMSDVKKPYYLFTDNNILYISEQGSNSIIRYNLK